MTKSLLLLVLLILVAGSALAQDRESSGELLIVDPSVDLNRYMGSWYEIARMPNRFQEDCAGEVVATYTLRDDGRIDVLNECRTDDGEVQQAKGVARLADNNGPSSKLEVRFAPAFLSFFPFVWGNYWILDLASDYSYAAVGEPNREYLWVLSRTPHMGEETYQEILGRLANLGYDTERLVKTRQETGTE
jgi:apolipoprotein D and lipocalin family protein